jgi:hypothetical protein
VGFSSRKSLDAIDSSLAPDNIDFPAGMSFSQKKIGKELRVSISIQSIESKKIETLISTLDEILAHIYSAIKTIEKAEST